MSDIVRNPSIANCNNRFYAGMTLEEAKANGVDKCTFRRDFHNVDKNKDGVLSADEIILERKRDAKISKWAGLAMAALGVYDFVTTKGFNRGLWLGINSVLTGLSFYDMFKINKGTEKIEEKLAVEKSLQEGQKTEN